MASTFPQTKKLEDGLKEAILKHIFNKTLVWFFGQHTKGVKNYCCILSNTACLKTPVENGLFVCLFPYKHKLLTKALLQHVASRSKLLATVFSHDTSRQNPGGLFNEITANLNGVLHHVFRPSYIDSQKLTTGL